MPYKTSKDSTLKNLIPAPRTECREGRTGCPAGWREGFSPPWHPCGAFSPTQPCLSLCPPPSLEAWVLASEREVGSPFHVLQAALACTPQPGAGGGQVVMMAQPAVLVRMCPPLLGNAGLPGRRESLSATGPLMASKAAVTSAVREHGSDSLTGELVNFQDG